METVSVQSIPIALGREEDGRRWADIESMPGVMAYSETRESAIAAVRALALRVAADCIDHGEEVFCQGEATFGGVAQDRLDGSLAEWLSS